MNCDVKDGNWMKVKRYGIGENEMNWPEVNEWTNRIRGIGLVLRFVASVLQCKQKCLIQVEGYSHNRMPRRGGNRTFCAYQFSTNSS